MGAVLWLAGSAGSGVARLDPEGVRDDRSATSRVDGLQPGSYEAHLWFNGREAEAISIELPDGGDGNLLLAFRPADGGQ